MPQSGTARRHGLFEAPAAPAAARLRVDPTWSPARLSAAVIRGVLPWVLSGATLLMVYNVAAMLLPVVLGRLVDDVVAPAAAGASFADLGGTLGGWAAVLAGVYLAMNLGYRFGGRLGWFGVQRSQFELAQAILRRALDQRGMAGPARAPGGLLSVATSDVHRACLAIYVTVYPPGEVLGLLTAAGVLLAVDPALGVGVVIALPLVLALMHLAARPLRRRSLAEQGKLAAAAAAAADLVAGYRVVRGLHAQHTAAARYQRVSRSALRSTLVARSARAGFDGLSTGTAQLFATAVAASATLLAFTGQITVGQLVTVAGVAVALVRPLDSLVGTLGSFWAVSQASARRVLDLLDTGPNAASLGTRAPDGAAVVRFAELRLDDGVVLDGEIGTGEFAVVRVPGPAREDLASVLGARASPAGGLALVAGTPTHDWCPAALRRRVLVVPHAPGVLSGTVLDNVRATGDEPVDADTARTALRVAGLAEAELPGGDATVVGDGGWALSGGQRQRVGLARGVAAEPEVLVLVEPTTSVDAVTEQRVATALHAHRTGRTTIVLTESAAFGALADRVLVPARWEGAPRD